MSKRVDATITCPGCGRQYPVKLYRTIWGEYEENRDLVMNDQINVLECPHCGFSFKAPFAFMYVDIKANFAVWWEPNHDPGVDSDSASYAKMFGVNSYYAKAPRISDWEEFKRVVKEYDDGIRHGGPIEKMDIKALTGANSQSKKSGCAGMLLALIIVSSILILL